MINQKQKFAILRIVFGLVWAMDAYFKWQPQFFNNFTDYLTGSLQNQPVLIHYWINFWIRVVGVNPHLFAILAAIVESLIALDLLIGFVGSLTMYGGILFSFVIWSTAEGFGGPYQAGSTDIGAAVIYILMFAALLISRSWEEFSIYKLRKTKF